MFQMLIGFQQNNLRNELTIPSKASQYIYIPQDAYMLFKVSNKSKVINLA